MKDIPWFELRYAATEDGRVWSHITWKYLKPRILRNWYLWVVLMKQGVRNDYLVHRLVALAYLTNTDNRPQINHKNWVKADNRIENLEWCTRGDNLRHSYRVLWRALTDKQISARIATCLKTCKKVAQFSKEGKFIKEFSSISEAGRILSISSGNIWSNLKWNYKSAWGFIWKYA